MFKLFVLPFICFASTINQHQVQDVSVDHDVVNGVKQSINYNGESYYQTYTEMRSIQGYYAWKEANASYFTIYNYFYTGFNMSSSAQSWVSNTTGLEKPLCYWHIPNIRTVMTNPSGYTKTYVVSIQFKVSRDANSQYQRKDVILYTDDNNAVMISYYLCDTFYYDSNNNLVSSFDGILVSCRLYTGPATDPTRNDQSANLWGGFGFDVDTFYGGAFLSQDLNNAYDNGFRDGQAQGYTDGYEVGYAEGLDGSATNPIMNSIFSGILEVGLLPINVFLTIFNFEIFGINISGFISGLLTISIIIIIVRFLFGGKSDD